MGVSVWKPIDYGLWFLDGAYAVTTSFLIIPSASLGRFDFADPSPNDISKQGGC